MVLLLLLIGLKRAEAPPSVFYEKQVFMACFPLTTGQRSLRSLYTGWNSFFKTTKIPVFTKHAFCATVKQKATYIGEAILKK
jgi:hypothetical protein